MSHPHVLTLMQVAELLGMDPTQARRQACCGRIPGTHIGRQWRFWKPAVLSAVTDAAVEDFDDDERIIVDSRALADLLGLPERSVAGLMRSGVISSQKVGRRWRAHWPTIRACLRDGRPLDGAARPRLAQTGVLAARGTS